MAGRREQLAREVRARLRQQAELTWAVVPYWACEAGLAYLWVYHQPEQVAAVTRGAYLAALKEHLPEALADGGAAAWALFQDRVHERGEFAPEAIKERVARWQREQAAKKAGRTPLLDGLLDPDANDLDYRSAQTSPEANRHLAEQQRLNRIANSVETRYF